MYLLFKPSAHWRKAIMPDLQHKRILLGITGGVAAYKAAELTRLLVKAGADVRVVMSAAATQFVTPLTFQALSGKPVFTQLWDTDVDNGMAHIELTRTVDAVLIAPASADFIAKLVHGRADDLLSTLCLARACPLLVAPAMNQKIRQLSGIFISCRRMASNCWDRLLANRRVEKPVWDACWSL
jgi:phosphopantothenoylcysteine decarboxylase/phosphopantothenate--cysteine ligase